MKSDPIRKPERSSIFIFTSCLPGGDPRTLHIGGLSLWGVVGMGLADISQHTHGFNVVGDPLKARRAADRSQ